MLRNWEQWLSLEGGLWKSHSGGKTSFTLWHTVCFMFCTVGFCYYVYIPYFNQFQLIFKDYFPIRLFLLWCAISFLPALQCAGLHLVSVLATFPLTFPLAVPPPSVEEVLEFLGYHSAVGCLVWCGHFKRLRSKMEVSTEGDLFQDPFHSMSSDCSCGRLHCVENSPRTSHRKATAYWLFVSIAAQCGYSAEKKSSLHDEPGKYLKKPIVHPQP